ncbi:unnamed protein product [Lepidochelys kempii]
MLIVAVTPVKLPVKLVRMKPPWNWPSVNSSAVVSDGVILGVAVRTAVVSLVMADGDLHSE